MITLYLVRHGESVYNAEGRVQGQRDVALSELGFRQAELVARRLACESFDAIYSSDLVRASATANVISAELGLPVEKTPLLRESKLGVVEGLTNEEISKLYPETIHHWRLRPLDSRPPGAESIEDVIVRARQFLDETLPRHSDGSRLIIVGHGGSIRGIIIAGLGLPNNIYRRLRFSNASLSMIELGDDPVIRLLNDTCHLDSMKSEIEEI